MCHGELAKSDAMVQRGPKTCEGIVLQDKGVQALDLFQACSSDQHYLTGIADGPTEILVG